MKYLLRVEGVNLDRFVFDTRDLSTIRGGSLMLLKATPEVEKELGEISKSFQCLSKGASVGLFLISTEDPVGIASQLRSQLQCKYPHATFVVDLVPANGDFPIELESVLACNRWRQMQASSLAVPASPAPGDAASPPACDRDGLRPALVSRKGPNRSNGSPAFLSAATFSRREAGRSAKQDFYHELTKLPDLPSFAQDFESIAEEIKPLEGKLAIFYADGNGFGRIQQLLCSTPEKQALWDHFIRTKRKQFLTEFLREELNKKPEWLNSKKGVARFETLLWGGDELMFIMPASLGWRFATIFFEKLGGHKVSAAKFPTEAEDRAHPFAGDPSQFASHDVLTYTAALVFCQHHAPIDRIKRLAKDGLAESAKGLRRDQDQLLCVVLESFDHLGTSYQAAMARRYAQRVPWQDMVISQRGGLPIHGVLKAIATGIRYLGSGDSHFARSQLRGLVEKMLYNPGAGEIRTSHPPVSVSAENLPRQFRSATDKDAEVLIRQLRPLFPSDAALWFQLEELWEYALP